MLQKEKTATKYDQKLPIEGLFFYVQVQQLLHSIRNECMFKFNNFFVSFSFKITASSNVSPLLPIVPKSEKSNASIEQSSGAMGF
jgi:hypothetical protein